MTPRDLLRISRSLASGAVGSNRGRPRQAELRRAVSAAYYALSHSLAQCCADRLAGSTAANRAQQYWRQIYRSLEHGHAKNQCENRSAMAEFPGEIQDFGRQYVLMQGQRQRADYSPEATFSRYRVMQLIEETEAVIGEFDSAPSTDRRAFAIHVLFRQRRE